MKRIFLLFLTLIACSIFLVGCSISKQTTKKPVNQLYSEIVSQPNVYIPLLTSNSNTYYVYAPRIDSFIDKNKKQSINATIYIIKKQPSLIAKSELVFNYDPNYNTKAIQDKVNKKIKEDFPLKNLNTISQEEYKHLYDQAFLNLQQNGLKYYAGITMSKVHTSEYTYDGDPIEYDDKETPQNILINDSSLRYSLALHLYKLKNKHPY